MARRFQSGVILTALSCVWLAGCATSGRVSVEPEDVSPAIEQKLAEAHAHYAQGMIYEMDEQGDLALQEFTQAALDDPSNEELVLDLARRYSGMKQPEKALELLKAAAKVPGASTAIFSDLALVYARLGNNKEAVDAAETIIKRNPNSLAGYQDLFIVHLQNNQIPEAAKALNWAAKVPTDDPRYLIDLAGLYASLQIAVPSYKGMAVSNGLALLKRAKLPDPPDPQLALKSADAYNLLGAETNAAQIYLGLLDKYGSLPTLREDLHRNLAVIYLKEHESKKAEAQWQAVLADDPANAEAYYDLGSLAYDDKKLPMAIDYFQKALVIKDDFEQAYYDLAGAQINNGEPKDALDTLAKARARFSTNFMNEFFTALAYVKTKDYTNAVAHFTAAEKCAQAATNQVTGYFYFEAGAACERNGEFDRASEYFDKCLKLEPDMPEALNYYGYMLADRNVKLDKARAMIEKAVKLDPNNSAYIDSLGWVLFRLDKLPDALTQELKAIELSGDDPDATLFDQLGDIYAALKQKDKARDAWKKSLALEPNDNVKKKIESTP
jgi:tetratricopeptide (TPR) repeat protein